MGDGKFHTQLNMSARNGGLLSKKKKKKKEIAVFKCHFYNHHNYKSLQHSVP